MKKRNAIPDLPYQVDDGLIAPLVGPWAEQKYKIMRYYSDLFSQAMRTKWDRLVYIDLFSGPGRVTIRDRNKIISSSPMLAAELPVRFDKYIFCDINPVFIEALRTRIQRDYIDIAAEFMLGDSNSNIDSIIAGIPKPNVRNTLLAFTFVDPYKLDNLQFVTLAKLSRLITDFLILIPAYMDANRNIQNYLKKCNQKIDYFLGTGAWRATWEVQGQGRKCFGDFVVDQFGSQMVQLGYIYRSIRDTILISNVKKNAPLYRLAFFSKNPLGIKLWKQTKKYTTPQLTLFDEEDILG